MILYKKKTYYKMIMYIKRTIVTDLIIHKYLFRMND
jgi:hypothetical protein